MNNLGTLYICPTPIGNLEDITLRAIRILKEVDVIACEDTRVTQKLLNHYGIATKLMSYHKFSEKHKTDSILQLLKNGQNVALVSDAGTPLISDPGSVLVKSAVENGIKVVPLPGACAMITAASATYNADTAFVFIGFLPRQKSEKEEIINRYQDINCTFYEAPSRLVKSLSEILEISDSRVVTVARELTKIYEEIKTDSIENLIEYYTQKPPKGEIVVTIHAKELEEVSELDEEVVQKINKLKKSGYSTKDISNIIALFTGVSKSKVYDFVLKA